MYTVPYDKGWKAFVNKKEVKIEKVDNGLMAVKINKGINNIKFIYYPPGLKLGLILSIVSYISLLVYIFLISTIVSSYSVLVFFNKYFI